jgi:hypothetical protein
MEILDNALRVVGVVFLIGILVLSYVAPAIGIIRSRLRGHDDDDQGLPRSGLS